MEKTCFNCQKYQQTSCQHWQKPRSLSGLSTKAVGFSSFILAREDVGGQAGLFR